MRKAFTAIAMLLATAAGAQQIDFDMAGRQSSEVTEEGYTPWAVTFGPSETKEIDGLSITVAATESANVLRAQWSKNNVNSDKMRLIGDGVVGYINDDGNTPNQTDKVMGISVTIEGLAPGRHTIQGYHNGVNNYKGLAPIDVAVNGTRVIEKLVQSENVTSLDKAATSYVTVDIKAGEKVTLTYTTHLESGKTYASSLVYLNALVFNKSDVQMQAQAPYPANGDFHADADAGSINMTWQPAPSAVRHHVYIGTEEDNLQKVLTTQNAAYEANILSVHDTYYWRVDEEDAAGQITEGELWTFRPRRLAFPGAEGYGKYAIGGRGGAVYHVTNLDDNGDDTNPVPGSLRYGIKAVKGPRTIVFDVGGVIALKSRLTCSDPYVTIAGHTAPGQGIMLRTSPFGMAKDGITRFLRMRLGHKKLISGKIPDSVEGYGSEGGKTDETIISGLDGMGMAGNDHSIMDHCSISWTIDEAFSSRGAKNITLQHTLISEALNQAGHPNYSSGTRHGYAATIGGGEMSSSLAVGSYHHNLLAHCEGRNWSISGGLDGRGAYDGHHDIFNNVVYNWGGRATDGGSHEINFVNNFYKKGAATSQNTLIRLQLEGTGSGTQSMYVNGNVRQETSGSLTQDKQGTTYKYETSGGQVVDWNPYASAPFFPSLAEIETPQAAYKNTLSDVGCTMPVLDIHDQRMIRETLQGKTSAKGSRSGKAGLIDSETDNGCEGFDGLGITATEHPSDWDMDADGMPDWWEKAMGLDPLSADNNGDADCNGYTNLEDYLNWLAQPHLILTGSEGEDIDLKGLFAGYTNAPSFSIVDANGLTASLNGSLLSVSGEGAESGLHTLKVSATDADNWGSLTREVNVLITATTDGISSMLNSYQPQHKSAVYNIAGQRISMPQKGINIVDGKKRIF